MSSPGASRPATGRPSPGSRREPSWPSTVRPPSTGKPCLAARARATVPAVDWHDTTSSAAVRKPSTGSGTCHGALLVATGQIDAFLLLGVGPWDIAALIPIVEEAGGAYSDLSGYRSDGARSALFSAFALHQRILDVIAVGSGRGPG